MKSLLPSPDLPVSVIPSRAAARISRLDPGAHSRVSAARRLQTAAGSSLAIGAWELSAWQSVC